MPFQIMECPTHFIFLKCPCEFLCLVMNGTCKIYTRIFCPCFFLHASLKDSFCLIMPFMEPLQSVILPFTTIQRILYVFFLRCLTLKFSPYIEKRKEKTKIISYTLSSQNDTIHNNPKLTFVLCPLLYTYIGIHIHIYIYMF